MAAEPWPETIDARAIVRENLEGYALPVRGDHGVLHWARVLENGLRIAEVNGADREVVTLFALFHDSRRINGFQDDGYGQRGGDFARSLRGSQACNAAPPRRPRSVGPW